jgi:molybdenum cofactor cytidylyltransferase
VLGTLREYGPATTIVVLGHGAEVIEMAVQWSGEVRVRHPAPERGIASSLALGFAALDSGAPATDRAFVVLADQPALQVETLRALEAAAADPGSAERLFIVPEYLDDPGPRNPVLVRRGAWPLVAQLQGDQGLASVIVTHPQLCLHVPVDGAMLDIDTPDDLERLAQAQPA